MNDTTRTLDQAVAQPGRPRLSLILYHGGRTRVLPLRPGKGLIVGRGETAEVRLEDETISRNHTRVELLGEEVWVEDLGSKNGTLVNGKRVQRSRITLQDRVGIGAAIAFVHASRLIVEAVAGVESHDDLVAATGELLQRARQAGRRLALVVLHAGGEVDAEAWFALLATHTRPYDRLGAYSSRTAELLLWDADAGMAQRFVEQLLSDPAIGPGARAGIATFPEAGSTEALLEAAQLAAQAAGTGGATALPAPADGPVVCNAAMHQLYAMARQLARSPVPVLIVGETGTGKELVARTLHQASERRDQPLITVNCAAIPANLIESELFGHERGAFTGADRRAKGLFEEADHGTLFLDEIGELSAPVQAALLRVLESKRFSRVGSAREIEVDVRLVAATHRDLEAMCAEGAFRWDLLFRINTVTLKVPPLRERSEEIGALAEHFLERACRAQGRPPLRVAPEVMALLRQYTWPGNVRELRNAMERGAALAAQAELRLEHLPERVLEVGGARGAAPPPTAPPPRLAPGELPAVALELLQSRLGPATSDFRTFIQRTEAALIAAALRASGGRKTEAARALGIPLRTLKERLRQGGAAPEADEETLLLRALDAVAPAAENATFKERVRCYERALIDWALRVSGGSRLQAGQRLRIPERTLRDKLREG